MNIADKLKSRDNNFDFLRFFAASLVILSHSFALTTQPYEPYLWLTGYATFGMLAVSIFFILSGFLITKSWLDNPQIAIFLKKRILRIIPGLFVAVVFTILIIGPLVTSLSFREYIAHPTTREYFNNAFLSVSFFLPGVFTDNLYKSAVNGSLWTLPVEFKLYMMVLALGMIGLFHKRMIALTLSFGVFMYGAATLLFPTLYTLESTQQDYLRCTVYFSMGIIMYLFRDKIKFSKSIFLIALILFLGSFRSTYGSTISYLTLPYMMLYVGFLKTNIFSIFSKYGDFSYGLYIYAFPVQQTIVYFSKNAINPAELFFSAFFVTLFLAICSWNFVEKPFMKLKSLQFVALIKKYFLKYLINNPKSINENV
jgi:peptidoglycan/LPS O-acetylase OafA/YrhL